MSHRNLSSTATPNDPYEPPALAELGSLHDQTLNNFAWFDIGEGFDLMIRAVCGDSGASLDLSPNHLDIHAYSGSTHSDVHFSLPSFLSWLPFFH